MYNNIGYRDKNIEVTWRGSFAAIGYKGMPPGTATYQDTEISEEKSIAGQCL